MAERIQVELVDDIDGSPANHTVTFALDGVTYEIDLNDEHERHLRATLGRYIEAARTPKPAAARTAREEEQARRANKQLTEQIRGAAQRTREKLSKKAAEQPEPEPEVAEPEPRFDPPAAQQPAKKKEPPQVSAVSLPLFSSAVD